MHSGSFRFNLTSCPGPGFEYDINGSWLYIIDPTKKYFCEIRLNKFVGYGNFTLDNNQDQLVTNGLKVINIRVPDAASYKFYKLDVQKVVCSSAIEINADDDDDDDDVTFHDFSVDAVDRHPISMTVKFPTEVRPTKRPSWFSRKLLC